MNRNRWMGTDGQERWTGPETDGQGERGTEVKEGQGKQDRDRDRGRRNRDTDSPPLHPTDSGHGVEPGVSA